ncbi:MAG: peptidoglycan recognition family protein, partial [Planctomycetaceae bacterium]
MLGFRCSVPVGFIPIVVCLGVFAGCAHGPLPPQAASRPQWVNPATPGIAKHPAIQADSWNPAVAPREWRHIVIHHTASPSGSVPSIHEAHLKRGWDGIGYHFLIGNGKGMEDGEIEPTFRWREQMHGAHAGKDEYNQHGIGICLVGNFQESSPSSAQLHAVRRLVATLKHTYGIST